MGQLSYVHGASRTPLIGRRSAPTSTTLSTRYGERLALVVRHQQIRWSWRQLGERVEAFAAGLLALGLEPGDRIGIWSPNNAEWVVTQFATAKAGLVLVNINPAYRVTELEYALNKVGCKALVTARGSRSATTWPCSASWRPSWRLRRPAELPAARLPALRLVITHRRGAHGRARCGSTMSARSAATPTREARRAWPGNCSSTTRSTSSSPAAPPASPRAPR